MSIIRRDLERELSRWKDSRNRRPLLLRGARQVGKSTLIEAWGKAHFESFVKIDLEQERQEIFKSLNPQKVVETISLMKGQAILPGKTLLFIDEIQESPAAITSLRYFFEQMPDLHVVSAGSLLELTLRSENLSMPVGRVEFLHLLPLSFNEFLTALGEDLLRDSLSSLVEPPPEPVHQKLLELVQRYSIVGGMPAVVEEYAATRNLTRCRDLQNAILLTYRNDFGKYASLARRRYLETVFERVSAHIGNKLVYSALDPSARSADLKQAVELLSWVGVLHRVHHTSGSGLPLEAGMNPNYYKALFLDVGLMQRQLGLEADLAKYPHLLDVYRGAVAEQWVGQELLQQSPTEPARLYYWVREARGSKAEVDYLLPVQGRVLPVEVKAGSTGTLKSLKLFMENYKSPIGIRISQVPLALEKNVLSVPFYLTSQVGRLAEMSTDIRTEARR